MPVTSAVVLGACVSMVRETGVEGLLSLPCGSVAVRLSACVPSLSPGAAGVRLHAPLGPTTTLAIGAPLS